MVLVRQRESRRQEDVAAGDRAEDGRANLGIVAAATVLLVEIRKPDRPRTQDGGRLVVFGGTSMCGVTRSVEAGASVPRTCGEYRSGVTSQNGDDSHGGAGSRDSSNRCAQRERRVVEMRRDHRDVSPQHRARVYGYS